MQRGVTLVELLVVLVIVSIALSLAVPTIGNSYDSWALRTSGQKTAALFRLASDTAHRGGIDIAGYYDGHAVVLLRNGAIYRELEMPKGIHVQPEKPRGAVFLRSGQIVSSEPFVLENARGRRVRIEFGPFPGQVVVKE